MDAEISRPYESGLDLRSRVPLLFGDLARVELRTTFKVSLSS